MNLDTYWQFKFLDFKISLLCAVGILVVLGVVYGVLWLIEKWRKR